MANRAGYIDVNWGKVNKEVKSVKKKLSKDSRLKRVLNEVNIS